MQLILDMFLAHYHEFCTPGVCDYFFDHILNYDENLGPVYDEDELQDVRVSLPKAVLHTTTERGLVHHFTPSFCDILLKLVAAPYGYGMEKDDIDADMPAFLVRLYARTNDERAWTAIMGKVSTSNLHHAALEYGGETALSQTQWARIHTARPYMYDMTPNILMGNNDDVFAKHAANLIAWIATVPLERLGYNWSYVGFRTLNNILVMTDVETMPLSAAQSTRLSYSEYNDCYKDLGRLIARRLELAGRGS